MISKRLIHMLNKNITFAIVGISAPVIPDERPTLPYALATSNSTFSRVNSGEMTARRTNDPTPRNTTHRKAMMAASSNSRLASVSVSLRSPMRNRRIARSGEKIP